MPDTTSSKQELRSQLRRRRQVLDATQQAAAARGIAKHITQLPGWPGAQRIGLYLAADGEIDPTAAGEQALAQGKQLFLPVIQPDNSLRFARWSPDTELAKNRYGIPEPPPQAERCPVERLDVVFLPLVGWDRQGGRLGMGGGFYDRTLAGIQGPILVGLAHTVQESAGIPREHWDVSLDFIATETTLIDCKGSI